MIYFILFFSNVYFVLKGISLLMMDVVTIDIAEEFVLHDTEEKIIGMLLIMNELDSLYYASCDVSFVQFF